MFYFLEERAKGVSHDKNIFWLSPNSDYDIEVVIEHYFEKVKQYVEEYVNNNSGNGKPITWGDITDKPTVYGTAKSSSHKHTALHW